MSGVAIKKFSVKRSRKRSVLGAGILSEDRIQGHAMNVDLFSAAGSKFRFSFTLSKEESLLSLLSIVREEGQKYLKKQFCI